MSFKTYGPRPQAVKLDDSDELFYVGSDVGNYMRLPRGQLYKRYPQLSRRIATSDERRLLPSHLQAINIILMKASEINDILTGNDEKYKAVSFNTADSAAPATATSTPIREPRGTSSMSSTGKRGQNSNIAASASAAWLGQLSSGAHHLDAVPCSTPVAPSGDVGPKRVKTYPLCLDDSNPSLIDLNANQPEVLVPIRLDMEIEGIKLRDCFCWNKNGLIRLVERSEREFPFQKYRSKTWRSLSTVNIARSQHPFDGFPIFLH